LTPVIRTAKLLELKNIRKSFGRLHALDGIDLDVEEKAVTILIGPNGSGKTTLINVVTGFYKPDEGQVWFGSTDVTGWLPHELYKLGMTRTFQIPSLFWKLTVLENLLVAEKGNPGEFYVKALFKRTWFNNEMEATKKAHRILGTLGLAEQWNKPASLLSGGQMKLLEIGRGLMSDAKLLFLDEPISGVNPTLAHEIFSRIIKLRDELGLTFLIVEHRLDVALEYVDYINAMALGKVIARGEPDKVISDPKVIEAYLGD
jgi:branched-chain amino acid transport system ATP-binding protein